VIGVSDVGTCAVDKAVGSENCFDETGILKPLVSAKFVVEVGGVITTVREAGVLVIGENPIDIVFGCCGSGAYLDFKLSKVTLSS